MKYGKVVALSCSHRNKRTVLRAGDPIKDTDVLEFDKKIKQGFIAEITEEEYREIYLEKNGQKPAKEEPKKVEEPKSDEEIELDIIRESENYKKLIKENKGILQEKLKDAEFVGDIDDSWTKDDLAIKIIKITETGA